MGFLEATVYLARVTLLTGGGRPKLINRCVLFSSRCRVYALLFLPPSHDLRFRFLISSLATFANSQISCPITPTSPIFQHQPTFLSASIPLALEPYPMNVFP